MKELLLTAASSILLPPKASSKTSSLNRSSPFSIPKKTLSDASASPHLLSDGRRCRRGPHLKHYADLASKFAADGRLDDFLMIAESVLMSGAEPSRFLGAVNVGLVSNGISAALREGKLQTVCDALGRVEKLGLCPSVLFDQGARELLIRECRLLVDDGKIEEFVEITESLAGYGFSVKEFVEPFTILNKCIERRDPKMAVRLLLW